jgi:hypothetical protein
MNLFKFRKILIPILFVSLFITFPSCSPPVSIKSEQQELSTAQELIENMKFYKTTNLGHEGDLYQHSIWTALNTHKWFDEGNEWCEGLTEKDKKIAVLTGFLHDTGKAGDLEFTFLAKPAHPQIGFDYLIGNKEYKIDEHRTFNFDKFFHTLKIPEEDRKLIAILVCNHHEFGTYVCNNYKEGEDNQLVFKNFIEKLSQLAQQIDYNCGRITKRVINLSVFIASTDIKAISHVDYKSSILEEFIGIDGSDTARVRSAESFYEILKHEDTKKVRVELLEYFETHFAQPD